MYCVAKTTLISCVVTALIVAVILSVISLCPVWDQGLSGDKPTSVYGWVSWFLIIRVLPFLPNLLYKTGMFHMRKMILKATKTEKMLDVLECFYRFTSGVT